MGFALYEIDALLRDALAAADEKIDPDTGEIPEDWARFLDDVQIERDKKALAVAAIVRECKAESEAIAAEAKRLIARQRVADAKAERIRSYLAGFVNPGEKLKDSRVSIGWRKSAAVVIDDETKLPESAYRVYREVSKTQVKELIESGTITDGAHIEERQNIQIR